MSYSTERHSQQFIYGNTARALQPLEKGIRTPRRVNEQSKKRHARNRTMTFGFAIFATAMMVGLGALCIWYIGLQSSVTSHVKKVCDMEIMLESKRAENDDTESRIKGAVGLEEIKRRAMDELGMTYAREDQIVIYNSDGTDYVRQLVSIE